ncbi:hypothetical protein NDI85_04475 [Halomicroarcula sp. S1AR25-4]|uniref:hypothetical protein n=1 Tax=Haloarcula sp. S1AR25-4 TaxID=2950538 RepID=UPI00287684FB|nr:hypothetical protein [Halomicroarcula sp. S1AR25-4]MDS0277035.1 hypothetical protein [Halomicroarcula sp. S1AR25-4]
MTVVDTLRRPEYTGANRCLPCTVVNSLVAAVLSILAAGIAVEVGATALAVPVALAVALPAAAAIYLRGYLVPGTPTLTKRYLPTRVLRLFGKHPTEQAHSPGPVSEIDVESVLLEVGAVEPCGDDLCLTEWFSEAWQDAVDSLDPDRATLLERLGVKASSVEFEEYGDAFRAYVDERHVGTWESRPAFEADVAAAAVLQERADDWDTLSVAQRGQVLNGLRLFVDTCPRCGGTPTFGTETVQSCCSEHEVAAVTCGDCEARLFESNPV